MLFRRDLERCEHYAERGRLKINRWDDYSVRSIGKSYFTLDEKKVTGNGRSGTVSSFFLQIKYWK